MRRVVWVEEHVVVWDGTPSRLRGSYLQRDVTAARDGVAVATVDDGPAPAAPATAPAVDPSPWQRVAAALAHHGPMSSYDLAAATGLPRPVVHSVLTYRVRRGDVVKSGTAARGATRGFQRVTVFGLPEGPA